MEIIGVGKVAVLLQNSSYLVDAASKYDVMAGAYGVTNDVDSYWRSTDRMTRHLSNLHVQFNGEVLQAVFARVSAEDPTCVGTRLYSACSWIARRGMLASLSGCGCLLRLLLLVMLHLATPTSTVTSEIYRWAFAAFVVTSLDHLRPPFDVSYNLPSFLLVHAQTASCLLLSSEVEEVGTNSSLFVYTRCHRLKH